MHYDDLMEKIGGCGRYQILLFCLLSTASFKSSLQLQLIIFHTYRMDPSCSQPWNSTTLNTSSICYDRDGGNSSHCTQWSYSQDVLKSTMVSEFDLICDRSVLIPTLISTAFLGTAIGSLGGFLGDRIGRRWVIIFFAFYEIIIGLIAAVVPTFKAQIILRFIQGLGSCYYVQACTFLTEIVSKRFRLLLGTNYWIGACFGYAAAGGIAKCLPYWRLSQLATGCVIPFYIFFSLLLWESPRWLLVRNRKPEAVTILKRMAKWNGTLDKISPNDFDNVRVEKDVQTGRFLDTLSTPTMRFKTLSSWFLMWALSLSYKGMSLDSKFSSNNIFLNSFYMGMAEIPGCIVAWFIGERKGRRLPSVAMLGVTTALILVVPHLTGQHVLWLRTVLAVAGKFVLTTVFSLIYIWIAELQPTCIRSVGFFSSFLFNALGAMISSFTLYTASTAYWLPSLIIGSQCGVAVLITFLLPETKGVPLQQTVAEADLLRRGCEERFEEMLDAYEKETGEREVVQLSEGSQPA